MMKSGFHIPHYTKIHAWDKGNKKAGKTVLKFFMNIL